jgi:hypothetical protein
MSAANAYRKIAAELRAKALKAPSDAFAAELDNLGQCYRRLADQADQNNLLDVCVEFGPKARLDEDTGA